MTCAELGVQELKEVCDDAIRHAADQLREEIDFAVDEAVGGILRRLAPCRPDGTIVPSAERFFNVDLSQVKGKYGLPIWAWVREMVVNDPEFECELEDLKSWQCGLNKQLLG